MIISIVGGGATGITILRHLAELATSGRDHHAISGIQLFDKSGFDGGTAYRTQSDRHLLNMKASTMSIRPGDPEEFLRWLRVRGLSCHGNKHLPRMVYRDYLDTVRLAAIAQCRSAGLSVHVEDAEIVRMRLSPDRDVLLTTDRNITHISSLLVLCTGHNAPDDHYGLTGNPNYLRDPYAQFTFADRDGFEIGILGSGLSAVDTATAMAKTHQAVKMTCLSRSGLFPTVQPATVPAITNDFRDALHRYVSSRERIEADGFAARLSELLLETTGIRCDLSCRNVDGDALSDLQRNILRAETGDLNVHSYLVSVIDVMCDAWSRMSDAEKMRFMDLYNSGWLRNRSAMPLENAIRIRDLMRSGRLSARARLRRVTAIDGRFRAILGEGDHHDVDCVVDATGPSYRPDASPLYQDMQRQGLIAFDALGGIRCGYDDSRVHDRHGTPHPNIYAVGGPTKGTHFYAAAVDVNMRRAQIVVDSILNPKGPKMSTITTSVEETDRLADLVRRDDPSLDTMVLAPDGKYQTRPAALDELMWEVRDCLGEAFRHWAPEDFPTLYCAWGRCRVGSTALTNLFGVAGMPSYFQPVKAILRHRLVGNAGEPWAVPVAAEQPHVFSKEMAGPYVLAESLFLPLLPLIEAGWPADKLHMIMLDRDPASSLASWLEKWSDRVPEDRLIQNYVISTLNALRVESYARRQGVAVTRYVYEASKDATGSVRKLFDRLGLGARFTESAVTDWRERGQIESKGSGVTFLSEPKVYTVVGLHGSDTAYRYRGRKTASLSDAQLAVIERYDINDIYRASVAACVDDLSLDADTAMRLFGDRLGTAA
ncbi:FAD/NAD(P)-binding protein [Bradyrhizobium canariense]|uniref:FAD/NAD(P)-binding protein n=1 Tax=Bradyrhizobium canariense TaxID=255045 RepID=UPI001CA5488D|nr:FAD/NAD(P)-binding domain-containing protein [Bradyrhizobium canariense]